MVTRMIVVVLLVVHSTSLTTQAQQNLYPGQTYRQHRLMPKVTDHRHNERLKSSDHRHNERLKSSGKMHKMMHRMCKYILAA